jgi:hypothetical protein
MAIEIKRTLPHCYRQSVSVSGGPGQSPRRALNSLHVALSVIPAFVPGKPAPTECPGQALRSSLHGLPFGIQGFHALPVQKQIPSLAGAAWGSSKAELDGISSKHLHKGELR